MIQEEVLELLAKEAPALNYIEKRELCGVVLQHNAKRAISSGAKTDKASIAKRPCFLCEKNRPKGQERVIWNEDFEILVNPFPILKGHLTIPLRRHEEQRLLPHLSDMEEIAKALPKFILFYNGAKCGASAPDHMHFQAVFAGQTPMEKLPVKELDKKEKSAPFAENLFIIHSREELVEKINSLPRDKGESEPKLNLFCRYEEGKGTTFYLFARRKHRPKIYDEGIMISPGALDMAGILVLAQREVFDGIGEDMVREVYGEV